MLAALFFRLGIEQRLREIGVLTLAQTDKLAKKILVVIYGSEYWNRIHELPGLRRRAAPSLPTTSTSSRSSTPRKKPSNILKDGLTKYHLGGAPKNKPKSCRTSPRPTVRPIHSVSSVSSVVSCLALNCKPHAAPSSTTSPTAPPSPPTNPPAVAVSSKKSPKPPAPASTTSNSAKKISPPATSNPWRTEAVKVIREALPPAHDPLTTALLINSRTDVALAVGARGVHLRRKDVSAQEVRKV